MSRGWCLGCGAEKGLALAVCPQCAHTPATPEDQARHLLVAEMAPEDAAAVASGARPWTPPASDLEEAMVALTAATPWRVALFALGVVMLPMVALAVLLMVLAAGVRAL